MIVSAIDGWLYAKQHGNASPRVSRGLPSSNDRDCRCVLDVRSSLSKYFVQKDATYDRVILCKMIVMQQSSVSCMPEYPLQHFSQFRRTPLAKRTISKHASALPLATVERPRQPASFCCSMISFESVIIIVPSFIPLWPFATTIGEVGPVSNDASVSGCKAVEGLALVL